MNPPAVLCRFLRRHDKFGGYLPLLAMPIEAAADWARLWTEVRLRDWDSERHPGSARKPVGAGLSGRYPGIGQELHDLSLWPEVEERLYRRGRAASLATYSELLYYRAFCPVYLCAALSLPGESRATLETFAMYVGYGAQVMDDTLDILEDHRAGRTFVTTQELDLIGAGPERLTEPGVLAAVTAFRNRWAMYLYLQGYRVTDRMRPANQRLARSWIEHGMRALVDGRIRPLPPTVLRSHRRYAYHFGSYLALMDLPVLPEGWRFSLLRRFVGRLVESTAVLDVRSAIDRIGGYDQLPQDFRAARALPRPTETPDPLPSPQELRFDPDGREVRNFVHYGATSLPSTVRDLTAALLRQP